MNFLSVVTIALSVLLGESQAQIPDACILDCAVQVCGVLTNFECFCTTGTAALHACVETNSNCSPTDFTLATQLSSVYCTGSPAGPPSSTTPSPSPPPPVASSPTAPAPSTPATSASSPNAPSSTVSTNVVSTSTAPSNPSASSSVSSMQVSTISTSTTISSATAASSKASSSTSASSSSNVMIGNDRLAGLLTLAVALAVAVGIVV